MYYLILLLIVVLSIIFVAKKIDIKYSSNYLVLSIIVLSLFLGLRANNVGLDMENYQIFFNQVQDYDLSGFLNNNFEFGFKLYTKFITLFTDNYSIYIFITSIISMIGLYSYIKSNSKNFFASLFLFVTFNYYIYMFCTLRQAMAISILMLSIKYIKENKFFEFLIFTLLASLFHKTAIFFLIIYFVKDIKYCKKYIFYYLLGALSLFIFRNQIIYLFTNIFYSQYINYKDMSGSGYKMLFLFVGIVIGICYLFKNFDLSKIENKLFFYMLLLTIPFQILATTQGLVTRITLYFSIALIILIPNAIESIKDKKKKDIYYILFFISLALFYCYETLNNPMYVHYKFLWFD